MNPLEDLINNIGLAACKSYSKVTGDKVELVFSMDGIRAQIAAARSGKTATPSELWSGAGGWFKLPVEQKTKCYLMCGVIQAVVRAEMEHEIRHEERKKE